MPRTDSDAEVDAPVASSSSWHFSVLCTLSHLGYVPLTWVPYGGRPVGPHKVHRVRGPSKYTGLPIIFYDRKKVPLKKYYSEATLI